MLNDVRHLTCPSEVSLRRLEPSAQLDMDGLALDPTIECNMSDDDT